jgi:HEAT repeat protein
LTSSSKDQRISELRKARDAGDTATLLEALRDPDIRGTAIRLLGKMKATEATPEISRLLVAGNPRVRLAAAKALAELQAVESARDVERLAVSDPDRAVRTHAIAAYAALEGSRATPTLIRLLSDPDPWVSDAAVRSLGDVGDESAARSIELALKQQSFFSRGEYRRALRKLRSRERAPSQ